MNLLGALAFVAVLAGMGQVAEAQLLGRHNFILGGGGATPGLNLTNRFNPAGFLRVAYGYRIFKNLQADTGIDMGFRSAGVKDFYQSQFGALRIRDYQYMVPFGARVFLPFGEDERVRIHAGGGGAYLRYSERTSQPFANSGIRLDCPVCSARSGWGTYGSVGASIGVGWNGALRFGGSVNVYRATTDGQGVGQLADGPSSDRWINPALELTFSF
jgi:hypothetical protein